MSKKSSNDDERLAFHEAGHAFMAIDKGIEVRELVIPSKSRPSDFQRLSEMHSLASANWPDVGRSIDRYVLFRLAGPAAEWTWIEKRRGFVPGSDEQLQYRERFRRERVFDSQADFDTAYALMFSLLRPETEAEADRFHGRYWLRACEALGYTVIWAKVQQIAHALLERRILNHEELMAIYETAKQQ